MAVVASFRNTPILQVRLPFGVLLSTFHLVVCLRVAFFVRVCVCECVTNTIAVSYQYLLTIDTICYSDVFDTTHVILGWTVAWLSSTSYPNTCGVLPSCFMYILKICRLALILPERIRNYCPYLGRLTGISYKYS